MIWPIHRAKRKELLSAEYAEIGLRAIKEGKVAVVLPLAGSNSRGGSVPRALVHLNGPE
jgi:hypothetical protein